jgi:hypothetical protein
MSERQFHQGMRLKKLIDNSHLLLTDIAEKTKMQRGSLYYMFDKEEILRSKILPILKVLEISPDDFYNQNSLVEDPQAAFGIKAENEALKRENELLRAQVKQLNEIIDLMKRKKK